MSDRKERSLLLISRYDASVNRVIRGPGAGQATETRVVRRGNRAIIYLSSQTACSQGCKMCHLTATEQTVPTDAGFDDVISAAHWGIAQLSQAPPSRVHFNFMARGEFFANRNFLAPGAAESLVRQLLATPANCTKRVLISTIMPRTLTRSLCDIFPTETPEIYYSAYSAETDKLRQMIPAAMPPLAAMVQLREWQLHSGKVVRIHFPLIAGYNDSIRDWAAIRTLVDMHQLKADFNLVRYNPPTSATREASQETYERAARYFQAQRVDRIGEDVYASCGMFYSEAA